MYETVIAASVLIAVIIYVVYSVVNSSKSLASFVQLGDIQRRDELYSASKASQAASPHEHTDGAAAASISAPTKTAISPNAPLLPNEMNTNREQLRMRVSFMLGLMNVGVSGFIIGAYPTMYYLWYSPKAIVFCLARWNDFRKVKQHYLLYDFCYWANAALLLYIWLLPHSATLFQICFLASNGPLAWAVLAFNQALVLHKWQQVVSVFIHVAPMILTYGLRWFPSNFAVCGDFPKCTDTTPFGLFGNALFRFYLWWIVLYWIWVFYFLGGYLKTRSFTTLYDRVASNQLKFLFGNDANAMFGTYQELAKKTIYMGVHLVFGCFTMLLALFFWYFWWAQFTFICLMISMSCFNASKFYLSTFDDEIMRRR